MNQSTLLQRAPRALALVAFFVAGAALAQSNTSGNINGKAAPGDKVIINGVATGMHREIAVDDSGKFRARGLPTGEYTVMIQHADGTVGPAQTVNLRVGQTVTLK